MASNVLNVLKSVAQKNNLKIDFNNSKATLKDIGIDSLAMLNLIFKVETELGVQLEDSELVKIKNLEDLISAFEKAVNNSK